MDDPDVDVRELRANFTDIELANRWFGGLGPVLREVLALEAVRVLDVGCGSGDFARALLRRARTARRRLHVVALDASEAVLGIARERTGDEQALQFVRGDAAALPFDAGSFDVATCNLALHHFEPPEAIRMLRELRRVASRAPLVCDLVRSRAALAATLAFARCIARNRLTKHDAPLSVRRAYTTGEAVELAQRAGWRAPRVRRSAFFRMLLSDGA